MIATMDYTDRSLQIRLIEELRRDFQMTFEQFCSLHHLPDSNNLRRGGFERHLIYCKKPGRFLEGGGNFETSRRLAKCLDILRGGMGWPHAMKACR